MAVQYKGDTQIREIGRERNTRGAQVVVTLTYQGLFADLIANEPSPGAIWTENNAFACETAKTVRTKAGCGETVVTYVADGSLQTLQPDRDLKIEIIWQRNDAPLTFQKIFADDSAGVMDIECLSLVEDYLQARAAAKRATIKTLIDAFGAVATKYLELRMRGVDSILRFLPIVRKTTTTTIRGIAEDLGGLEWPDIGSVPYPVTATYWDPLTGLDVTFTIYYMKMRDDITKTGRNKKWERIEEWHGYPEEDLRMNGRIV